MIAKIFFNIGIKEINQTIISINIISIKLKRFFKETTKLISEHPKIGKLTIHENIRIKIVRDYLIIYEDLEMEIRILSIWSSYQYPVNMEF